MDLAKLKKLEAAASPAPWWFDDTEAEDDDGRYRAFCVGYENKSILDTINSDSQVIYDDREEGPDGPCGSRYDETGRNDVEFIAEMRNATPKMISAIEHALGCFSAAEAEGWSEAIRDGDIDRIRDLWQRRISFAVSYLGGEQT